MRNIWHAVDESLIVYVFTVNIWKDKTNNVKKHWQQLGLHRIVFKVIGQIANNCYCYSAEYKLNTNRQRVKDVNSFPHASLLLQYEQSDVQKLAHNKESVCVNCFRYIMLAIRNTNHSMFSANRHVLLSHHTMPQYWCTVCSNTQEQASGQCHTWYRSCETTVDYSTLGCYLITV